MGSSSGENMLVLFVTLLTAMIVRGSTETEACKCNSYSFPNNVKYAACKDLAVLESSLHWNYHPSSGTVDVAFNKANAKDSSWIAWAINPTSKGMVGSQAFVALYNSDGSIKAYTSPITSYATLLKEGLLTFPVYTVSASYANGHLIIFATFQLPSNTTLINHAWQQGLLSDHATLLPHSFSSPNLHSFGALDFLSGKVSETDRNMNSRTTFRNVHGTLNTISWGIMMPIGVIMGRYLKVFDGLGGTWFQLHRACQSLALLIGIAGFGSGLYMGNHYGLHHTPHRCVGITLMCLAFAQVCVAVCLRPKKDHKYRMVWNVFHYVVGYATIALAIWNVLKGFDILDANKIWKKTYVGIILSLAAIAIIMEIITWIWVCNKNRLQKSEMQVHSTQQQP
ncbi:cytochrome b561 and DOMON domain-containing protein At5g47530 [Cajanus cajan]|nr:cytochrome b561 and DOMON domain-containing protein At5g47530 [Cajanus cajan]